MTVLNPINIIKQAVSEHFEISVLEIESDRRSPDVVTARHAVMTLAKEFTHHSIGVIGRELGKRDRTSVQYGLRVFSARLKDDPGLAASYHSVRAIIATRLKELQLLRSSSPVIMAELAKAETKIQARTNRVFQSLARHADERPLELIQRLEGLMFHMDHAALDSYPEAAE